MLLKKLGVVLIRHTIVVANEDFETAMPARDRQMALAEAPGFIELPHGAVELGRTLAPAIGPQCSWRGL